jgi:hypothetical protein
MKPMPTNTASDRVRRLVAAGCLALSIAAGCAGAKSRPVPPPPVLSPHAAQAAILAGVESLADFRRERVVSLSQHRAPAYAPARKALGDALVVLRPSGAVFGSTGFEGAALALETAGVAMDRIIAATSKGDARAEAVGWEMFDQSVGAILLAMRG